jgi:hypothetical protein
MPSVHRFLHIGPKILRRPLGRSRDQQTSRKPATSLLHGSEAAVKSQFTNLHRSRGQSATVWTGEGNSRKGASLDLCFGSGLQPQDQACVYETNEKVGEVVYYIPFPWMYAVCMFVISAGTCGKAVVCTGDTFTHNGDMCV